MRFHSHLIEPGAMDQRDVVLGRLKLLIVMAKAYLRGFPTGEYRSRAMAENARQVENNWKMLSSYGDEFRGNPDWARDPLQEHLFGQRIQLLSVMVRSIAMGYPMGEFRRQALIHTIEEISRVLVIDSDAEKLPFLKVA